MPNQHTDDSVSTEKYLVRITIRLVLTFIGLILLMHILTNAEAATIIVSQDGNGDHEKIQDAIDAAEEGDTILVRNGTYNENIQITKTLNLEGEGYATTAIIGDKTDSVVQVLANFTTLSGFRITGSKERSSYYGGIIVTSHSNSIRNNLVISNEAVGILVRDVGDNIISDNICNDSYFYGISLATVWNSTVTNNTCESNEVGIRILFSNRITLERNSLSDNEDDDLWISASENITCYSNSLLGNGFLITGESLHHTTTHIIPENNTAQGQPIIYITNETGMVISNLTGGFILANCSDITIDGQSMNGHIGWIQALFSSEISITNMTFTNNSGKSVYFYRSEHSEISNTSFRNSERGITAEYCHDILIENNTFENHGRFGIQFEETDSSIIRDNQCVNSTTNIELRDSEENLIENNSCNLGRRGIGLVSSNSNTITRNTCTNITPTGASGISMSSCDFNIISHNTILNNYNGIEIQNSDSNSIIDNTCKNTSSDLSIELIRSHGNIVSRNFCENNDKGGIVISSSNENTVSENICVNSTLTGIVVSKESFLNIVHRNTVRNNRVGISVWPYVPGPSDDNIISWNIIENSTNEGIVVWRSEDTLIHNNTITDSDIGIHVMDRADGTIIHHNSISGSREFGIKSDDEDYTVDALWNWWGNSSGPYHPDSNPEGNGDNVTDYVDFDPWIEEEEVWPPEAHIDTISPNPAIEGESIRFAGLGTDEGSIIGYAWHSDIDGELYNGSNDNFTTSDLSLGEHNITLRVQDNHGVWSDEVYAFLQIYQQPIADFIINAETYLTLGPYEWESYVSEVIVFNGLPSSEDVNFTWDFGDTTTITSETPITPHTYDSTGTYDVNLTVFDEQGYSGVISGRIVIVERPEAILEIRDAGSGESLHLHYRILVGQQIILDATDSKGDIKIYQFGFDLPTAFLPQVARETPTYSHTYNEAGVFNVGLRVIDNLGRANQTGKQDFIQITVHEKPVPIIRNVSPNPAAQGSKLTFDGDGTDDGTIERYLWRTEGSELYNGTNSSFTISTLSVGNHTVYLRVQDNYGLWSNEVSIEITILTDTDDDGGGGGGGLLPGFGVIALIGAIGITIVQHRKKRIG